MSYNPIIINQSNLVPSTNNNVYEYNFPAGSVKFQDKKIALGALFMFNSIQNVSSTFSNTSFQIIVPVGASTTTLTITLTAGYYSITDINQIIQSTLISNGIGYLLDSNGNYIYYIELTQNSPFYSFQLSSYQCPTSVPSGYTNPGSWTLPTTVNQVPQLVIGTIGFGSLIGFDVGTFPTLPTQTTTYTILSTITPEIDPTSSIIILCNIVRNVYNLNSQVLDTFTFSGVPYGGELNYQPSSLSLTPCQNGYFTSIQIRFVDQNGNNVKLIDTALTMKLLITE